MAFLRAVTRASAHVSHPNLCLRRQYSLLNVFREPPDQPNDSHLRWEDRDHGQILIRVTFAAVGLAGLALFGMYKMAGPDSPVAEEVGLVFNPYNWTQSIIIDTKDATPGTKLITVTLPSNRTPKITDKYRPIWHAFVNDDDIMVQRPYTPLTGFDVGNTMQFWVKSYEQGEVGRWLNTRERGTVVDVRGPIPTWTPDEDIDELVFVSSLLFAPHHVSTAQISGGTGVTPFLQLFSLYIKNPFLMPRTKFTLLHSAKTPQDLMPQSYLTLVTDFAVQNPNRLKVEFFVESDPPRRGKKRQTDPEVSERLHIGRITRREIQHALPSSGSWYQRLPFLGPESPKVRRMFLVCGPSP